MQGTGSFALIPTLALVHDKDSRDPPCSASWLPSKCSSQFPAPLAHGSSLLTTIGILQKPVAHHQPTLFHLSSYSPATVAHAIFQIFFTLRIISSWTTAVPSFT